MQSAWNIEHEQEIVWVGKDPDFYDYVREGFMLCHARKRFPLKSSNPAECTDGGPLAHIVAYTIWDQFAPASESVGIFLRRYWWVKGYDRWRGHGTHNGGWYHEGAPSEAVFVWSIVRRKPSMEWDYRIGRVSPWLPVPS